MFLNIKDIKYLLNRIFDLKLFNNLYIRFLLIIFNIFIGLIILEFCFIKYNKNYNK